MGNSIHDKVIHEEDDGEDDAYLENDIRHVDTGNFTLTIIFTNDWMSHFLFINTFLIVLNCYCVCK